MSKGPIATFLKTKSKINRKQEMEKKTNFSVNNVAILKERYRQKQTD